MMYISSDSVVYKTKISVVDTDHGVFAKSESRHSIQLCKLDMYCKCI